MVCAKESGSSPCNIWYSGNPRWGSRELEVIDKHYWKNQVGTWQFSDKKVMDTPNQLQGLPLYHKTFANLRNPFNTGRISTAPEWAHFRVPPFVFTIGMHLIIIQETRTIPPGFPSDIFYQNSPEVGIGFSFLWFRWWPVWGIISLKLLSEMSLSHWSLDN